MSLKHGGIVILDYGSQTTQLIARRVRELGVFAALLPYTATLDRGAGGCAGISRRDPVWRPRKCL